MGLLILSSLFSSASLPLTLDMAHSSGATWSGRDRPAHGGCGLRLVASHRSRGHRRVGRGQRAAVRGGQRRGQREAAGHGTGRGAAGWVRGGVGEAGGVRASGQQDTGENARGWCSSAVHTAGARVSLAGDFIWSQR